LEYLDRTDLLTEDEWWMNHDSGEPASDITKEVNRDIDLYMKYGEKYLSNT